jgi:hypothetical protein
VNTPAVRGAVTSRTGARRADAPARHTPAPGRKGATLYLVAPAARRPTRHCAPVPRTLFRGRPAHVPLNGYDRFLFWVAGSMLRLRTAIVGERVLSEHCAH